MMPGLNGFDVPRRVVKRLPKTKVVILSMYSTEAHVVEALRSGAAAYVLKDARPEEVVSAIREAAAGRRCVSAPFRTGPIDTDLKRNRDDEPYAARALGC